MDKFFQMVETDTVVNTETANWALRACSTVGNLRSAGEILKVMLSHYSANENKENSNLEIYVEYSIESVCYFLFSPSARLKIARHSNH